MDEVKRDLLAVAVGLLAGWVSRFWRTPHEKQAQNLDLIGKLSKELNMAQDELLEAFADMRKAKKRQELLIGYLIQTLEHMRRKGLKPLPLPAELESDPELFRFFKKIKAKEK